MVRVSWLGGTLKLNVSWLLRPGRLTPLVLYRLGLTVEATEALL